MFQKKNIRFVQNGGLFKNTFSVCSVLKFSEFNFFNLIDQTLLSLHKTTLQYFATDAEESGWIEKNCRKGWDQIVGFENFNKLLQEDVTEVEGKVKHGDSV